MRKQGNRWMKQWSVIYGAFLWRAYTGKVEVGLYIDGSNRVSDLIWVFENEFDGEENNTRMEEIKDLVMRKSVKSAMPYLMTLLALEGWTDG